MNNECKEAEIHCSGQRPLTIRECFKALRRTRLSLRIIVREGEDILYDVTAKRDRLYIDDVPDKLLDRYPKRTTICDLKGVTKTIYFEL